MAHWTLNSTRRRASTSTRWHFAFRLCCHSNETHAPIANWSNSAQLGGTPYHPLSNYIWVHAVVWASGEGQTDIQMCMTNIHLALSMTRVKCNTMFTRRNRRDDHMYVYRVQSARPIAATIAPCKHTCNCTCNRTCDSGFTQDRTD